MKLVSIIIPTFNRGNKLTKCIESIINQTYKNIEIIISDDGSTDNTKDIIYDIQQKNESIPILYLKQENKGAPSARNYGFEKSNGDYIIFFDSDDTMEPTRVEEQIKSISEYNANCNACGFNIMKNGKIVYTYIPPILNSSPLIVQMINGLLHSTQSWMYHREIISTVKGYDISLSAYQDLDLCFRVLSLPNTKVSIVKEALSTFYDDNDQTRITSKWLSIKSINSANIVLHKMLMSDILCKNPLIFNSYINYLAKKITFFNTQNFNYSNIYSFSKEAYKQAKHFSLPERCPIYFNLYIRIIFYTIKYTILKIIK